MSEINFTPIALITMLDEAAAPIPQYREKSLYALAARMIERLVKENEKLRSNQNLYD